MQIDFDKMAVGQEITLDAERHPMSGDRIWAAASRQVFDAATAYSRMHGGEPRFEFRQRIASDGTGHEFYVCRLN